jgi:hypothetical protein
MAVVGIGILLQHVNLSRRCPPVIHGAQSEGQ